MFANRQIRRESHLSSWSADKRGPRRGSPAGVLVLSASVGRTLSENGLEEIEVIDESTGRLVVNRASYQLKAEAIAKLISALQGRNDG